MIPFVAVHDKEQTQLSKEKVSSDQRFTMLESENKELRKDVQNLSKQIGSLVEMITNGLYKIKETKRSPNKETPPSASKRRVIGLSDSSSASE